MDQRIQRRAEGEIGVGQHGDACILAEQKQQDEHDGVPLQLLLLARRHDVPVAVGGRRDTRDACVRHTHPRVGVRFKVNRTAVADGRRGLRAEYVEHGVRRQSGFGDLI